MEPLKPSVRIGSYEVSLLPTCDPNYASYLITVENRDHGQWVVKNGRHSCRVLSSLGTWSEGEATSDKADPSWRVLHYFDLTTALRLAQEAAPKLEIQGMTVERLYEWYRARGFEPPSEVVEKGT